jgi:high-affinity K+ transport system ATPase subunit B
VTSAQRKIVAAIIACVAVFLVAAVCIVRYGGSLTVTLLAALTTVLTPSIGALVTQLIVAPLRDLQKQNVEATARVETKVNGQMDAMRAEVNKANSALAEGLKLSSAATQKAVDVAESAKNSEQQALNELTRVRNQLRALQGDGPR